MSFMGISDAKWAVVSPAVTYWGMCAFYEIVERLDLFRKHRIYPSEEECKRNLAKKGDVIRHVLTYNAIQAGILLVVSEMLPAKVAVEGFFGTRTYFTTPGYNIFLFTLPWLARLAYLALKQFVALVVIDTWVFWGHYIEHQNRWVYKKVHSVHHELYVPFAWGALYNHWAESLFIDGMGAAIGPVVAGLTDREQIFYYAFLTGKTVHDHCGYDLPFSPYSIFSKITGASSTYHNIHHQTWGLKANYEIYFTWWDRYCTKSVYMGPRTLLDVPKRVKVPSKPEVAQPIANDKPVVAAETEEAIDDNAHPDGKVQAVAKGYPRLSGGVELLDSTPESEIRLRPVMAF
ncbi:hypothetical protein K402DRAFT_371157 [Aulographum hederae CBS 113979]|uniref:Fatty acid hydroxylase domain-containing protein n=1 Tax=Aulographum hederae CBS 113979 TaxID=1176131 RepID=A0A6G1HAQ4_9PEZI|nr:hypothetical protein K402DRAFT_371157 [Aulographum hederae CBS 113979]